MRRIRANVGAAILLVAVLSGCSSTPEAKSAKFVAAGKKLLEKKDVNRAILQFLNAAQATPKNPEVYYQLAMAYLAGGDLGKGVASLRKTLELNPKHAAAQLSLAKLEIGANDPSMLADAQQRLQNLLQDTPQDPDALHTLALTELKLGAPADAMRHLENAILAAPADLVLAMTLAEAKLRQQDYKGAEQVLKGACEKAPKSTEALVFLGRLYEIEKQFPEAEQEFRKALAIAPDDKAALWNLAGLQDHLGRKQEAEQNYKRLSSFSDKTVNSIYATFLFQEGRKEEAIREFDRLAKLDPDDRIVRTRLVAAYFESKRTAEAEKVLADALKRNPKEMDALLQRGELLVAAGKYSEAETSLNQVLHLKPDSPDVHYALAKMYQATGKAQLYRQELNEALRLNPFLLPIRLEEAKSLIASKDGAAALALLGSAPQNQRELVPVVEQLNWALLSMGQKAEVRKAVEREMARVRTPDLLLQDAILKISDKRYAEARQSLHEALTKNPEDLRVLRLLVGSYSLQNQVSAAVTEIRAYAAEHPGSAAIQFFLGQLLMDAGDRAGAKQVITAAKKLNPDFTKADLSLAQINLIDANWKDARQELDTILSTKGEESTARKWLGMLEVTQGNPAAAIADFRKVVDSQPNNAIALNNLAFLLAEDGNVNEALKYAQKAVELVPGKAEFEDTLGWVLYRKGLFDAAVTHLQSAVSKSGDLRLQYHLAAAYFRKGDETRGHATLTAALRKDPTLPEAQLAKQAEHEANQKRQP